MQISQNGIKVNLASDDNFIFNYTLAKLLCNINMSLLQFIIPMKRCYLTYCNLIILRLKLSKFNEWEYN